MVYKVYKIYSSLNPHMVYIGSTKKTLRQRLIKHKGNYNDTDNRPYSYKIFDAYGVDTCTIELVKTYNYEDRKCAQAYEQLAINKFRMEGFQVVNKVGTIYIRKMYFKQYREDNKDKLKEKKKKYYEDNKEQFKEQRKKYREDNKDKIKKQRKKYREKNKDKINAKITCELCGLDVLKRCLKLHQSKRLCEQRREQQ